VKVHLELRARLIVCTFEHRVRPCLVGQGSVPVSFDITIEIAFVFCVCFLMACHVVAHS
jgi:hypothetical protein